MLTGLRVDELAVMKEEGKITHESKKIVRQGP